METKTDTTSKKTKNSGKKILVGISKAPANIIVGIFNAFKGFFIFIGSSFKELGGVTWLSAKDTLKFSTLILLFMILLAGIIAALDFAFFRGLKFLVLQQ